MFTLSSAFNYYLHNSPTDMRKSFDGLCHIITSCMHRNPLSGEVFLFINRRRDRMKLLRWEYGGFILYYKRLESGTFELPVYRIGENSTAIYWPQLMMMVEGISLQHIRTRKRHLLTKIG
ncbi:MAG: IS66 family insertion sequence element accessory protein TnpB [Bacteroidetes bacterium]|nr:IS66 family insertion sequence element accessory protein TnpB [Bacteroidota bacterium]